MSLVTVSVLDEALQNLVYWENFAIQLPGLNEHDVEKIAKSYSRVDTCKYHVYSEWLKKCPQATWENVIEALKKRREYTLVEKVKGESHSPFETVLLLLEHLPTTLYHLSYTCFNYFIIVIAVKESNKSQLSIPKQTSEDESSSFEDCTDGSAGNCK